MVLRRAEIWLLAAPSFIQTVEIAIVDRGDHLPECTLEPSCLNMVSSGKGGS
jgi:hypothetical protein